MQLKFAGHKQHNAKNPCLNCDVDDKHLHCLDLQSAGATVVKG